MIEYTYWPGAWKLAIAALLLAAVVWASYAWARGRSGKWLRSGLAGLRWAVMLGVLVCLLDPEMVEPIRHQQIPRVAVLLDSSRSMGVKDMPGERLAAGKAWIEQGVDTAGAQNANLEYYSFNEELAPLSSIGSAKPGGESTSLAEALQQLLATPNPAPLTSVVLCSDGIQTSGEDVEAVARQYRRKGIPIHTITFGSTNEMRDIVVENVQVRRAVPNQAPTKVSVLLRAPGFDGQTVPVQILHNNELVAIKDVRLHGADQRVQLDFTPRQKGFQIYEARVPGQKGEWLTVNNRRLFGLEVIDPTIRVIYMEGTPQQPNSPIPEWKYLKSALESDPNIKVKTLYREFGATGKRLNVVDRDPETGEQIYPVEHPTQGFPQTLSGLLEYDVVIHSDIRKESFTSEQLQNMARLVEEFGGGFVMIGGNSAFGKGGYHRTILDRIIPAAMQQDKDSQARPFRLHVPPAVWAHPIIALGRTRQETELIWTTKFPLLYGCNLVDRAKPGAIVLGDDPTSANSHGSRLILAVQNIGHGRSMAFTSDTTRTWGKDFETLWGEKINPSQALTEENCDSRYYRQFWANAVRWLAAGRVGRTNNAVTLDLAQSYCVPGERVSVSVHARDKEMREISTADVSLLVSAEGRTNVVAKAAYDNARRAYVADFSLPAPGQFVLSAVAAIRGIQLGDDRQLLVCEARDREMTDLRARPDVMASVARLSGGTVLESAGKESSLSKALISQVPAATVEYRRNPLWDRSWWLACALVLLTVEWGTRRLHGMA